MLATCKHLGIDPFAYLREALPGLFALRQTPEQEPLLAWLPISGCNAAPANHRWSRRQAGEQRPTSTIASSAWGFIPIRGQIPFADLPVDVIRRALTEHMSLPPAGGRAAPACQPAHLPAEKGLISQPDSLNKRAQQIH
jgi:hypothetical protein